VASQWHYLTDDSDEPQGPVSSEQLKKLAAAGKLAPDDMVWKEGMADWVEAAKLKGLFSANKPASDSGPAPAKSPAPAPPPPRNPAPAPAPPRPSAAAPGPAAAPGLTPVSAPANPYADLPQNDLFGGSAPLNAGMQPAATPQQVPGFAQPPLGQSPMAQSQMPTMQPGLGNPYAPSSARPKGPFRPKVPTQLWAIFLTLSAVLLILAFVSPWWGMRVYRPTSDEMAELREKNRKEMEENMDEMRERIENARSLTPEELKRRREEWEKEAEEAAEKEKAWRKFYKKYDVAYEDDDFEQGELEEGESKIWLVWGWQTGSGVMALVFGLFLLPAFIVFGFVKPLQPWSWLSFLISVGAGIAMILVFPNWFFSNSIPDENMAPVLRQGVIAGPWMALVSGLAISVCGATGGIMGLVAFIKR